MFTFFREIYYEFTDIFHAILEPILNYQNCKFFQMYSRIQLFQLFYHWNWWIFDIEYKIVGKFFFSSQIEFNSFT